MITSFKFRQFQYTHQDEEEEKPEEKTTIKKTEEEVDHVKEFHKRNFVVPTTASAYLANRKKKFKKQKKNEKRSFSRHSLRIKSPNKSQNISIPLKKNSKIFNIQLLTQKFLQIPCSVSSFHGSYDFICLDPFTEKNKLVCIDCVKEDPEKLSHFQSHSEYFVRIQKFLEICTLDDLTFEQSEKVADINRFQESFDGILSRFEKETEKKIFDLKNFFKETERKIIEVIKEKMRDVFIQMVDDYKEKWDRVRKKMLEVKEKNKTITNFVGGQHLVEIDRVVIAAKTSQKNVEKLEKQIDKIVKFRHDLNFLIDSWGDKVKKIPQKKLEKELMPSLDFTTLSKIFKEKEILIGDEIDNVLAARDNFDLKRKKRFSLGKNSFMNYSKKGEDILDTFRIFYEEKNKSKSKKSSSKRNSIPRSQSRGRGKKVMDRYQEFSLETISTPGKVSYKRERMILKQESIKRIDQTSQREQMNIFPFSNDDNKSSEKKSIKSQEYQMQRMKGKENLNPSDEDYFQLKYGDQYSGKDIDDSKKSKVVDESFYDPIKTCRLDEIDQKIHQIFGMSGGSKEQFKNFERDPLEEINFLKKLNESKEKLQ